MLIHTAGPAESIEIQWCIQLMANCGTIPARGTAQSAFFLSRVGQKKARLVSRGNCARADQPPEFSQSARAHRATLWRPRSEHPFERALGERPRNGTWPAAVLQAPETLARERGERKRREEEVGGGRDRKRGRSGESWKKVGTRWSSLRIACMRCET